MPDIYNPDVPQLIFADPDSFTLFVEYLQESTTAQTGRVGADVGNVSLYKYCVKTVQTDTYTIIFRPCFGLENVVGKFFYETDRELPTGIVDKYTHPKYKQSLVSGGGDKDYLKGVRKVILGRQGEADIPEDMIGLLQASLFLEFLIQEVNKCLSSEMPPVLRSIVTGYLSNRDRQMSFFPSDSQLKKHVLNLINLLTSNQVRAMPKGTWIPLLHLENGLPRLEVGVSKKTGACGVATPELAIYLSGSFLTVLDKRQAFQRITGADAAKAIKEVSAEYARYEEEHHTSDCVIS